MRKMLFLFWILFIVIIHAQNSYGLWNNVRNSAVTDSGSIILRCETSPVTETEFMYRNDAYWHTMPLELLQGTTHQTSLQYSSQNATYCRFKNSSEGMVTMMPAFIPENSIPPTADLLGFIAEDPLGDTESVPEMDIKNTFIGYSDDHLFVGIENSTGLYPTNDGGIFPSEYYFYIAGFINVETAYQDSVFYGITYANIPVLFTPGLYKIVGSDFSLDSIQKIGDISYEIVDGVLVMACNWQDLIDDEHFGNWPSISNSLGFDFMTQTVDFSMELNVSDYSTVSMQICNQYVIEPFENILPEINNPEVSLNNGNSTVTFSYFDENGHFPLSADIYVGNSSFQMLPTSFDYTQPVTFTTTFPDNTWNEATIKISDNNINFVEELVFPTSFDSEVLPLINEVMVYPNPFNPQAKIDFTLEEDKYVNVDIFDCKGRKCANLFKGFTEKGNHTLVWNAQNQATGMYFVKVQAGDDVKVVKTVLLK